MLGKITTGYQITIPAPFRKQARIHIGDYIDIKQKNNKLILTPVSIIEKNEALLKFNKIFSKEINDDNFDNLSEEEIMNIVEEEITKSRN